MAAIILVSHSYKITEGLKEMIEEMTSHTESIEIISAGGTDDQRLGTDAVKISEYIRQCAHHDNIYLFADLGSAVFSIEAAIELIEDEELANKCTYVPGPIVEGAFVASVQCMVDPSKAAILREAEKIRSGTFN